MIDPDLACLVGDIIELDKANITDSLFRRMVRARLAEIKTLPAPDPVPDGYLVPDTQEWVEPGPETTAAETAAAEEGSVQVEDASPPQLSNTPVRDPGVLRPFIFSAEGVYGYVNDKPSFEHVVAQFGSTSGVLDGRMTTSQAPSSSAPTFTPDGHGDELREWLGPAIEGLVDSSMVTLSGGHNSGHAGCC